ncbi:hypothetical protein HanRHA438_Chr01g0025441 [Helianthus annuus]|nr:hypothetical protein HanRHA438_Chr01g0025441 [Helianthus annuus]
MRVTFRKYELNRLSINECHEPEHSFLLVRDPNILNRAKHAIKHENKVYETMIIFVESDNLYNRNRRGDRT